MRIAWIGLVALLLTGGAAAQTEPPVVLAVTVVLDGQTFEGRLTPGSSLVAHSQPVPIEELPEGVKKMPKKNRCFPARQLVVTLDTVAHGQAVFKTQLRNDAGEFRCEASDTYGEVWTSPTLTVTVGASGSIRQTQEGSDGYDMLVVEISSVPVGESDPAAP